MKRICVYLLFVLFLVPVSFGQKTDILFLKGKSKPVHCKILTFEGWISAPKLTYVENKTTSRKDRPFKKVSIILTRDRQLYVNPSTYKEPRNLLNLDYDLIFLSNERVIATDEWFDGREKGEYKYIDYFSKEEGSLNAEQVVAIYKNDAGLEVMDMKPALSSLRLAQLPENTMVDGSETQEDDWGMEDFEDEGKSSNDEDALNNEQKEQESNTDEKREGTDEEEPKEDDSVIVNTDNMALPIDQMEFENKARLKVEKFAGYVKSILEGGSDRIRAQAITEKALGLFISDTATIEVSSKNRNRNLTFTIKKYFNRLSLITDRYSKIEVTNGSVVKIDDLRRGSDDQWFGTVSYGQRFSGYRDGVLQYTDYTVKKINIVMTVYAPPVEGMTKVLWDVQLSNISVEETSE